jgi:hypothetical protein
MNNALVQAIQLNNEAAILLQAKNTTDALRCFQGALVIMKSSVMDNECNRPGTLADWTDRPCSIPPANAANNLDCDRQVGTIFFYSRPMVLFADNAVKHGLLHEQVVTAFIVFNLALAYHRLGIETGTNEPLKYALKLYQIVLTCQSLEKFVDDEIRRNLEVLICVALNNLSHLHFEFCDYSSSMQCMDSMAEWVMQTDCLECPSYLLQEFEAEGIKLNIVFTHCPMAAHAA